MRAVPKVALVLAVSFWGGSLALAADPPGKVEVRRAESKPGKDLIEATEAGTGQKVYLHKRADLTNEDIAQARVLEDKRVGPAVEIVFTKAGQAKMAKLSKEHLNKPVALLLDGKVLAAPVIRSELKKKVLITGQFTRAQAQRLANAIKNKSSK